MSNGSVLVSGADKCAAGVGNPANIGQVGLILAPLDADGDYTDPTGVGPYLLPNEALNFYTPPSGTVTIMLIGDPHGVGTATLEYDMPIS
jgi:hypothetical protein